MKITNQKFLNVAKITFNKKLLFSQDNIANAKEKIFENRSENTMSKNSVVPEAREALNRFKMEAANDLGVPFPS